MPLVSLERDGIGRENNRLTMKTVIYQNKFIERRGKIFQVSSRILVDILNGQAKVLGADLPDDAEVGSIHYDHYYCPPGVAVAIYSASYDPVDEDEPLPYANASVDYAGT